MNDAKALRRATALAERHGCRIVPYGRVWRVLGAHVDILTADLSKLNAADFPDTRVLVGARHRDAIDRWKLQT